MSERWVRVGIAVAVVLSGVVVSSGETAATQVVGMGDGISTTAGETSRIATGWSSNDTESIHNRDSEPLASVIRIIVGKHPDPGVVSLRIEVEVSPADYKFRLNPGANVTVKSAEGFERTDSGWVWREATSRTRTPSLSGTYSVNETNSVFNGLDYVDTGQWAIVDEPFVSYHHWWDEGRPPVKWRFSLASDTEGYAGTEMAFLGEFETVSATIGGQNLTVVIPTSPTMTNGVDTRRLLDHLEIANRLLQVGLEDQGVNVFIVDAPIRDGGLAASSEGPRPDGFWLYAGNDDESTRFSEYIHTRQEFTLTARMDWFVEAQDGYYSAALAREVGMYDWESFREDVVRDARDYADVNLLDPDHPVKADYDKGARVLAALDAKIRQATSGNRSLKSVWRTMNLEDETITFDVFSGIVEDVAGRSFETWLRNALTTSELPTVPRDPSLFSLQSHNRSFDTDGDGLSDRSEVELGSDPTLVDTDSDGLNDSQEVKLGTDPIAEHSDGDLLNDSRERTLGTNGTRLDTDRDGLGDGSEVDGKTNATIQDTDGDGLDDGREVAGETEPLEADTDGDGVTDGRETDLGTAPTLSDTEDDGLTDEREIELGTDPTVPDTDDDGVADGREIELGTAPTVSDTDGDRLADGRELTLETDPTSSDTDDDGVTDGQEVAAGSDPADPSSPGSTTKTTDTRDVETNTRGQPTPGFALLSGLVALLAGVAFFRRRT